jgi:hypothetical protein
VTLLLFRRLWESWRFPTVKVSHYHWV